jgi:hypothetical protein
MYNQ